MTAQVSPIVGVYTASARPMMKPPPTNVAKNKTDYINTPICCFMALFLGRERGMCCESEA